MITRLKNMRKSMKTQTQRRDRLKFCIICNENSCIVKGKYRICLNHYHKERAWQNEIQYRARPER